MGKIWFTDYPHISMDFKSPEVVGLDSIECITNLDEGSDNKGSGGVLEGFVYGKEYEFKISKYYKDRSISEKMRKEIVWEYEYVNDDGEVINNVQQEYSGDKFKLKIDDLEILGKEICIYCHLGKKESGASLSIFCHYRFRNFDKKTVDNQIKSRKNSPWKIDQGSSSLCGIALTGFYLARDEFDVYEKFINEIHQKGLTTLESNNYNVEIDSDEHLLNYKISDSIYPRGMQEIDFIFMLTIKDQLNIVWDYDPNSENVGGFVEGGTGLTLPNEIETIFKKINNYEKTTNNTNLITSKWNNSSKSVSELKKMIDEGFNIAILIEGGAFQNNKKASFSVPTHWVGLLNITDDTTKEIIEVEIYTWGTKHKKWKLSYDVFKDSYYGYVSGK